MESAFTLIARSWTFFRKTPVLLPVFSWLFFLPGTLMRVLIRLSENRTSFFVEEFPRNASTILLFLPAYVLLLMATMWGMACVLVAGRRIHQSRAGRVRTSFTALRKEAAVYVLPLLFTEILRSCFTVFWGLLLIVPGVIYAVHTALFPVIVVHENLSCREALRRSKALVMGHTRSVFLTFVLLIFLLFGLAVLLPPMMEEILPNAPLLGDALGSALMGLGTLLFLLALTLISGELKNRPQEVRL